MFFRQYYLGCLSHASYLIGDTVTGEAVVVDPQRDVAEYLAEHCDRLDAETRRFTEALFTSTLPAAVLDAISSQISIPKSAF